MTVAIGGRNVPTGAVVAGVGGACAVVGALLAWFSVSGKTSGVQASLEWKGLDSTWGILALVLGIAVLALVFAWVQGMSVPNLQLIIVGAGIAILAIIVLSYVTDIFSFKVTVTGAGVTATMDMPKGESVQKVIDDAVKGGASGGFAIGFFLEVAAGVLAIVGGALGLQRRAV